MPTIFAHKKSTAIRANTENRKQKVAKRKLIQNLLNETNSTCNEPSSSGASAGLESALDNQPESNFSADVGVNTYLSFSPFDIVQFQVSQECSSENNPDGEQFFGDVGMELDTESDASESEDEWSYSSSASESDVTEDDNEHEGDDVNRCEHQSNDDISGMMYMTYFSCLIILFKHCLVCRVPSTIQSVYTKGSA